MFKNLKEKVEEVSQWMRNIGREIQIFKNGNARNEKCNIWNEKSARCTSKQIIDHRRKGLWRQIHRHLIWKREKKIEKMNRTSATWDNIKFFIKHVIKILDREERGRMGQKKIWRCNSQKFSKFRGKYQPTDSRNLVKCKDNKHKENNTEMQHGKLLKVKYKEQNLKAARKNTTYVYIHLPAVE